MCTSRSDQDRCSAAWRHVRRRCRAVRLPPPLHRLQVRRDRHRHKCTGRARRSREARRDHRPQVGLSESALRRGQCRHGASRARHRALAAAAGRRRHHQARAAASASRRARQRRLSRRKDPSTSALCARARAAGGSAVCRAAPPAFCANRRRKGRRSHPSRLSACRRARVFRSSRVARRSGRPRGRAELLLPPRRLVGREERERERAGARFSA
eukprot:scaffold100000_cov27-Tisochrysis_lutea.AAC.2